MIFRSIYTFVAYYLTLLFFGVFGLALSFMALMAGLLPTSEATERVYQRLIHGNFALFVWWLRFSRLCPVRYSGLEGLVRGGSVLAANHPGLTDITFLLAVVPEALCIFKPAIRRNPVLGAAARRAGYLSSDGGHDLVRDAATKVAAGHTLVIFPEGTRTPAGTGLLPLKPGFVLMAQRAGVPIQLVRIVYSAPILGKGMAWWKPPPVGPYVEVTVGPRVPVPADADAAAIILEIEAWFRSAVSRSAAS